MFVFFLSVCLLLVDRASFTLPSSHPRSDWEASLQLVNNTSKYGLTGKQAICHTRCAPSPTIRFPWQSFNHTRTSASPPGSIFANDRTVINTALHELRDSAGNIYVRSRSLQARDLILLDAPFLPFLFLSFCRLSPSFPPNRSTPSRLALWWASSRLVALVAPAPTTRLVPPATWYVDIVDKVVAPCCAAAHIFCSYPPPASQLRFTSQQSAKECLSRLDSPLEPF